MRRSSIASEDRRIASPLDEEGARLTVSLTDDRERHSRLASELQQEAQRLGRREGHCRLAAAGWPVHDVAE
jgi:hypothetical protein